MTNSLNALFGGATAGGNLTQAGAAALAIGDLGTAMQAGLGVDVSDVTAQSVVLLALIFDDSSSIGYVPGNEQAVRDGSNGILDALISTKQVDTIFALETTLNTGLICPFTPITAAPKLTPVNYRACGGTPLYDTTAVTLGTVIAKHESFASNGVQARTVTIIITDGADYGSTTHKRPESIQPIIADMLRSEQHVILFLGIDDGGKTDFRDIARRMGIADNCVLIAGCNASEIRQKCVMASQSAVRVSQAAAQGTNVSQAGGFGGL